MFQIFEFQPHFLEGIKLNQKTMGKDKSLLGCGTPLSSKIDLENAIRVSWDTKELWDNGNEIIYGSQMYLKKIPLEYRLLRRYC
jgi:hypothetical protein